MVGLVWHSHHKFADRTSGMIQLRGPAENLGRPWADSGSKGKWRIQIQISKENADTWMRYLSAACKERGWKRGGFSEVSRKEQRGFITITQEGTLLSTLGWERRRGRALTIRGRSETPEFPLSELQALLERVSECCASQETQEFFNQRALNTRGYRGEASCGLRTPFGSGHHRKKMKRPMASVHVRCWLTRS
jgi:hypothetical protein